MFLKLLDDLEHGARKNRSFGQEVQDCHRTCDLLWFNEDTRPWGGRDMANIAIKGLVFWLFCVMPIVAAPAAAGNYDGTIYVDLTCKRTAGGTYSNSYTAQVIAPCRGGLHQVAW